ncbi:MAG: hypothetical protein LLG20_18610 [Acidobacteriales bacterium]|nr:hypothetical protein [Terriglobales bacterium]
MIRVCEKCSHITGQRHCVYCGHGEPGQRPRHSFGLDIRPKNQGSRQQERHQDITHAMQAVNEKNLKPVYDKGTGLHVGFSGMSRKDRRKLARAYFKGEWRKRKAA